MNNEIKNLFEKLLVNYTSGDYYDTLLKAKEEYFLRIGPINEDGDDYEARMNAFNEWYIFQFEPSANVGTFFEEYAKGNQVAPEIFDSVRNINHSLFEYLGKSIKGDFIFKDILHKKKIVISHDEHVPAIMKNDLFLGRMINYKSSNYLMDGICLIPREVKEILKKEAKNIRKLKDPSLEIHFLFRIEYLKAKWLRFNHLPAIKIFKFDQ